VNQIVSASYVIDGHEQQDGSRWVKESYVDSNGATQTCLYKLPAGQGDVQAQANMDARVIEINRQIAGLTTDG
jgi:hypothetical protein